MRLKKYYRRLHKKFKDGGFTLIELLVVIAIIGILSSVVLASLNSARTKGRNIKATESIKQLMTGMMLYYDDYGKFPCHNYQTTTNGSNPNFLRPLTDQRYISSEVFKNHKYPIEYQSISDSGPGCGQFAYIGFYTEGATTGEITCPYGLGHSHVLNGVPHCHQILPHPMWGCPDPYWITSSCPAYGGDSVNEY